MEILDHLRTILTECLAIAITQLRNHKEITSSHLVMSKEDVPATSRMHIIHKNCELLKCYCCKLYEVQLSCQIVSQPRNEWVEILFRFKYAGSLSGLRIECLKQFRDQLTQLSRMSELDTRRVCLCASDLRCLMQLMRDCPYYFHPCPLYGSSNEFWRSHMVKVKRLVVSLAHAFVGSFVLSLVSAGGWRGSRASLDPFHLSLSPGLSQAPRQLLLIAGGRQTR